ncbi:hypothetical protein [Bacteroides stercoris]|uniref:hypothetical protein n=1 Tax=Bacteroides stercoris TaxID=46506 RepID=UPI00356B26D2
MKTKQVLSVEQMEHLQELGLSTSDGSMCWCYALSYKNAKWELEIYEDVIDQKRDSNFWETLPTYTLQDILDKLPPVIKKYYWLAIRVSAHKGMWYVEYNGRGCTLSYFYSENLIDAAYEMLCWCIENGDVEKEGK